MSKNILIFADGTGQAGGFRPDQALSNVYKLFRATRSGPDSPISPSSQVAFYDPGLGTTGGDGVVRLKLWDLIKRLAGSIGGIGISTNVIDCYEAILKHYEPGDRIFLFGFSRGAYTARSVAGVLNLCGVPQHDGNGRPLPRSGASLRRLAREAVVRVYDHGAGKPRADYEEEREELARRFRIKYGSGDAQDATVYPYFIGLFDAVAALGLPLTPRLGLTALVVAGLVALSWAMASLLHNAMGWDATRMQWWILGAMLAGSIISYLSATLKWITRPPPNGFWLPSLHIARWRGKNYDRFLDPRVNVVRHALAIDETRRSFVRVKWGRTTDHPDQLPDELERFQQYWFAGNHSDVGGSYPEDESRLSDVALTWMVQEATDARHPILLDESKLRLYPAVDGPQHCQVASFRDAYPWFWPSRLRVSWPASPRAVPDNATLHPSVLRRFELEMVTHHGAVQPYRPESLRNHRDLAHFYVGTAANQSGKRAW